MFALMTALLIGGSSVEELVRPALPGFVVGYQQSVPSAAIVEEIPEGETVEKWTRMVTTQRFTGLTRTIDPKGFLTMLAQGASGGCPGATASSVQQMGPAAQVRFDCPLNPATGLPETFIARAIPGASDLHVAQIAWRKLPGAKDLAWAEAYLSGVQIKP